MLEKCFSKRFLKSRLSMAAHPKTGKMDHIVSLSTQPPRRPYPGMIKDHIVEMDYSTAFLERSKPIEINEPLKGGNKKC